MTRSVRIRLAAFAVGLGMVAACSTSETPPPRTAGPDALSDAPPPRESRPDGFVIWTGSEMSDDDLARWREIGAGGVTVPVGRYLDVLDVDPHYVKRVHAAGLRAYASLLLSRGGEPTPLADWRNDAKWATVEAQTERWTRAMRAAGFDGLNFDSELYDGGSWRLGAAGLETKAAAALVKRRGAAFGNALRRGWGSTVHVIDYYQIMVMPGTYSDAYQYRQFDLAGNAVGAWTDGLVSADIKLDFADHTFYKDRPGPFRSWRDAIVEANDLFRKVRTERGWPDDTGYAMMAWFDSMPGEPWSQRRPVDWVADQLAAGQAHRTAGAPMVLFFYGGITPPPPGDPYGDALRRAMQ